jgi:hypothetical protein
MSAKIKAEFKNVVVTKQISSIVLGCSKSFRKENSAKNDCGYKP